MKLFINTTIGVLFSLFALSQAPDYDDLKILYADANYDKLVRASEKYTNKDDTKKDPLPYMWMAKGLFKLSVSGEAGDEYKNAFKDAIGVMGKSMKYDTDGAILEEHSEFVNEFTLACVERIMNDVSAGDYRKAYSWNIKYLKISKNTAGAKYMEGACKYRNSDKGGANTSWKEAEAELKDVKSLKDWMEADAVLLRNGIIQSAECFVSSRQVSKAQELLNKYAPWFEEDEDFKTEYDRIMNN